MLAEDQWRCDKCTKSIYWYRWERSRVIATNINGRTVSICLDCWPNVEDRYDFVGLTTVKGVNWVAVPRSIK